MQRMVRARRTVAVLVLGVVGVGSVSATAPTPASAAVQVTNLASPEAAIDVAVVPGHGTAVLQHTDGASTSTLTLVGDDGLPVGSFGGTGSLTVPFAASTLAVADDGRLVVAGARVARVTLLGALDAGFGTAGLVTPGAGPVADLALTGSGAIVAAGQGWVGRYLADGSGDPSFGTGGTLAAPAVTGSARVAVTAAGRVVVLTGTGPRPSGTPVLLGLTDAGQPEPAFGTRGLVVCECAPHPAALVARARGDLIVVDGDGSLTAFTADGRPEVAFGVDGRAAIDPNGDVDIRDAVVDAADGVLLAGSAGLTGDTYDDKRWTYALVERYGPDGVFDTAAHGRCGFDLRSRDATIASGWQGVAIDPAAGLVLAGSLSGVPVLSQGSPDDTVVPVADCGGHDVAIEPQRVLDTRIGVGAPAGVVPAGGRVDVQVAGRAGLPTSVASVTITVTATDAVAAGFITAWPSGGERPTTSVLNLSRAGDTAAGLVTLPVGRDGKVSLFTQRGAHLLVDVSGYQRLGPGSGSTIQLVTSIRLLDTRVGIGAPAGKLAAGQQIKVDASTAGVSFPVALVGTLTVTEPDGDGYVTVWPVGERPVVSNINVGAGQTRSNQVVVPLDTSGQFSLYVHTGAHVILDVTSYERSVFLSSGESRFVARSVPPTRVLDTREGTGAPLGAVPRGGTLAVSVGHLDGVAPERIFGVVATLTLVDSVGPGFVTAWPDGPLPVVSNLNVDAAGQTRPVQITVPVTRAGALQLYVHAGGHVLLDVTGYLVA